MCYSLCVVQRKFVLVCVCLSVCVCLCVWFPLGVCVRVCCMLGRENIPPVLVRPWSRPKPARARTHVHSKAGRRQDPTTMWLNAHKKTATKNKKEYNRRLKCCNVINVEQWWCIRDQHQRGKNWLTRRRWWWWGWWGAPWWTEGRGGQEWNLGDVSPLVSLPKKHGMCRDGR